MSEIRVIAFTGVRGFASRFVAVPPLSAEESVLSGAVVVVAEVVCLGAMIDLSLGCLNNVATMIASAAENEVQ